MSEELTLEALDLQVGESKRIRCPQCRAEDERSLKLTRTESGLSYICFRGKCGFRGYTGQPPSGLPTKQLKYAKLHFFDHPTRLLKPGQLSMLQSKYRLHLQEIKANRFKSQTDQPRLVMPIFDAEGEEVGCVAKKMANCYGRKSMTYWHKERPNMHYPRCGLSGGPVALLEDTLSSIRVARHCRSRALLGTHIADNVVEQLKKETDEIILALDNDMITKMVRQAQQLRGLFKVSIVRWPKDPKDMEDEDIQRCLNAYLR